MIQNLVIRSKHNETSIDVYTGNDNGLTCQMSQVDSF